MRYEAQCSCIVEGCPLRLRAQSLDELALAWVAHVRDDHAMDRVSPEMLERLRASAEVRDDA